MAFESHSSRPFSGSIWRDKRKELILKILMRIFKRDCTRTKEYKKMKGMTKTQITIDSANIKIENGNVTIDLNPEQLAKLTGSNQVELSTLKPKDEFKLGDEVFIVLEHTDSGTRIISKEFVYSCEEFGVDSNWKTSHIRTMFNNTYFRKIADIIGEKNILSMDRDLTSLDGLDDYGTCTDRVSLLTAVEYAKYHKILGLKSNYPDWWWTITPVSTPSNGCARSVCCVSFNSTLNWRGCFCYGGVRPLLNLKSSTTVSATE